MSRISLTGEGRRYILSVAETGADWEDFNQALEWFIMAQLAIGRHMDTETVHMNIQPRTFGTPVEASDTRRAVARLYEMGLVDVKED